MGRYEPMKGRTNYEGMSVSEQIRQGLREGLAHARGKLKLKTTTLPAPEPRLRRSRSRRAKRRHSLRSSV